MAPFARKIISRQVAKPIARQTLILGGKSLAAPGSAGSNSDSAAASQAIAEASIYFERALDNIEYDVEGDDMKGARFVEKVQRFPEHRLQGIISPYNLYEPNVVSEAA